MGKLYTYIFFLLFLFLATGCSHGYTLVSDPIPVLSPAIRLRILQDCFNIMSQISYVQEDGVDFWQNPKITATKKSGDCEDQAIYFQYLLYQRGVMSEVVFGKMNQSDLTYHAWVECKIYNITFLIDPTNYVFSDKRFLQPNMYVRTDFNFHIFKKVDEYQKENNVILNLSYNDVINKVKLHFITDKSEKSDKE